MVTPNVVEIPREGMRHRTHPLGPEPISRSLESSAPGGNERRARPALGRLGRSLSSSRGRAHAPLRLLVRLGVLLALLVSLGSGPGANTAAADPGATVANEITSWLSTTCETWGQYYGKYREEGTDFCLPYHTAVYAVESGRVLGVNPQYGGGGVLSIEAAPTISEYYQHMSHISVSVGQQVQAGDLVGYSGGQRAWEGGENPSSPNYSGGPHLEFGINAPYGGTWHPLGANQDPVPYLKALMQRLAAARTVHTAAALIPHDGASGYVLDGYGGLHAFGNAPAAASPATWPGWDIARSIAVVGPGKGYVLDGWGGLHPFGGAPNLSDSASWPNWDIARAIALCPSGEGGYVLDGYGGLHPIGNAQPLAGGSYWSGWDIARGFVLNSRCTGGYVLDGYGGVHPFGSAPAVNAPSYWNGWDIARSITLVSDSSGYVLDGYGGIHPFAATSTPMPSGLSNALYDSADTDPFAALVYSASAKSGFAFTSSDSNGVYRAAVTR
jgi:murein DD-endopeptidase MepM/ murein hydrolase activator NlpD